MSAIVCLDGGTHQVENIMLTTKVSLKLFGYFFGWQLFCSFLLPFSGRCASFVCCFQVSAMQFSSNCFAIGQAWGEVAGNPHGFLSRA